jgi:thioredoxin 1
VNRERRRILLFVTKRSKHRALWIVMRSLQTPAEFDAAMAEAAAKGKLLVVDFTASWCGPCQRIAPVYEALAAEFKQVTFVKVDVDENQETAAGCGVSAMPTFKGFRDKKEVFTVRGADEATLRASIAQHAGSKFEGEGQRLGGAGGGGEGGMSEREKRLAALERRGLCGGGGGGGSGGGASQASAIAATSPVAAGGSYMSQVEALVASQGQGRPPAMTDPAVKATVAAVQAAAPSPPKIPAAACAAAGGNAAAVATAAAIAKAKVDAEVAAAVAAERGRARVAAAQERPSRPVAPTVPDVTDVPGEEDAEAAMLAAAIAASLGGAEPSPNAGEVVAPPPNDYAAEKEQLRAMGFADDATNQAVLEAHGGNVERALESLLG